MFTQTTWVRQVTFAFLAACLAVAVVAARSSGQAPAVSKAAPAASAQTPAEIIDAKMSTSCKADGPGGAAIFVKDGKVLLRKSYGLADIEFGIPVEPDMPFRVGSVTKQFTAAAILLLAQQGKLSIDDPIRKFSSDWPTQPTRGPITVEHLLTHTSGIKSYTAMKYWRPSLIKDVTVTELIDVFKSEPPEFAPDQRFLYNNSGYALLGAIIEKVSGETYGQFIQKHIFDVLGMKHSYYDETARIIPRRVRGYEKKDGKFIHASYVSMTQPYAAGSLMSTVDDLALWDAALYTDTLLNADSRKRMFTAHLLGDGRSSGYGYGWFLGDYDGHPAADHTGGVNGFACYVLRMPKDKVYVALLTAGCGGGLATTGKRAAAVAIGKPLVDPPVYSLDPATLDAYVGLYRDVDFYQRHVTRDGNKLMMTEEKAELLPASPTEFFYKGQGGLSRVLFEKGPLGQMQKLIEEEWGNRNTFTRVGAAPGSAGR